MRVAVYGLGNVVRADEAFGPYVVEVLRATYELPPDVRLATVLGRDLDLAPYLARFDAVILVDAVSGEGVPGELHALRLPELLAQPPWAPPTVVGLREALLAASARGEGPEDVLLLGVVPETTSTDVGLSRPVWQAVPQVLAAVVAELRRLGVPVGVRERLEVPRIWWEEPVTA